jgi:cell division GTPase FtsZ
LISFAVMPFKNEKDRIFNSGIALKRLRENSNCAVVLDNDSPKIRPKIMGTKGLYGQYGL